ncbi:MAG: sigma-54-dependent Fis family transcriptional regulator [Proteobacteria bacterium]|nr:sigma-54-dependent Fis family transcriptional regulator [Pseudomonadota bacterium]
MTVEVPGVVNTVLLVGDDAEPLELTRSILLDAGIGPVLTLTDSRAILPFLEQNCVSLVIFEMTHTVDRADLLSRICSDYSHLPVIVETVSSDVEIAVNCMKFGAVDYMVRPVEPARLVQAVEKVLNSSRLQQESLSLKEYLLNDRLEHPEAFTEIKTTCRKMRSIFQYTEVVACSPQAVLITGETGVGKELFARAIHRISRVRGQFVSINVAGLDDAMFSDTLFGHKKGAFTGADQCRDGLVCKAAMGTLFLDEIGDLNELSQVKLLRLLQEREYYPVGADLVKTCSARIVLATNVNLQERIKEGHFRRDLYYRLCTHQIHIPALRERREDIPLLLDSFVEVAARHFGRSVPVVSPELIKALAEYDFPGNVRELQAKVSDAVARHEEGLLTCDDFSGISTAASGPSRAPSATPVVATAGIYSLFGRLPTFREIEDYLIVEALKLSEGNYAAAAAILGVTRQTISKRLKSIESVS